MNGRSVASGVALLFAVNAASAQTPVSVVVTGPAANPITDAVGTFRIRTFDFIPADLPIRLELQVSTSLDFSAPLFADTTVDGPNVDVTIPRLLPSSGVLFWRAIAFTARAGTIPSQISGPATAPTHLRLTSPNNASGQSLGTRRPTFVWHASSVPPALGGWEFEVRVEETATGRAVFIANTNDTILTAAQDLESNTSYRWRVKGRLRAVSAVIDSVEVASIASFVILSDLAPLATVLLHPFPSPFPSATASRMCIWFDLRDPGPVTVQIINVRGLPVRTLVPGNDIGRSLQAGRYGRPFAGATSGCDDRFSWDGTDAAGRVVPSGTYTVLMRAGGKSYREIVIFRGR